MTDRPDANEIMQVVYALPEIVRGARGTTKSQSTGTLTIPQVRALLRLAGEDYLTMGELARRLGVSLASATQIVDRLADLGLAERQRPDWDRRVVLVRLTEQARPTIRANTDHRIAEIAEVFDQLTADEARGFAKGCQLLAEVLFRDMEQAQRRPLPIAEGDPR